ncbi:MAG: 2,3-bisphosphoglycerate-independent phosphoglycerate mutase, partial [Candidatus Dormibacteria bacterium]
MSDPGGRPVVLCICDGWGESRLRRGNAVALARKPNYQRLRRGGATTTLAASGTAVGLPRGQQGNSEVGHLTIGAGRVVPQDLTRIDQAIHDQSWFRNAVLAEAIDLAREPGRRLHLMGLVSPGGVHSHQRHLVALCEMARRRGLERVAVHAFTDGRDTPPRSGRQYLAWLLAELRRVGVGELASVGGRYYAMDRDRRWERTARAYRTLVGAGDAVVSDPLAYLAEEYRQGRGDEFVIPTSVARAGGEVVGIAPGDVVIHFNFRPDRARQICHALVDADFSEFDRGPRIARLRLFTLTRFDDRLRVQVAFPREFVGDTLGEVVSRSGGRQLHLAETEKYAHVTYFLNGGREEPWPGEERLLIPSPRVPTYDAVPEMSAEGITAAACRGLEHGDFRLIAVNFANADMVGHSGDLEATVTAVEYLDRCLGQVAQAAARAGATFVMTADHGNAEAKLGRDGSPLTAHTTSPVPLLLCH